MSTIVIFIFLMMKQIMQMFISDVIFLVDPDIRCLTEYLQYFRLLRSFCPLVLQIKLTKIGFPTEMETQSISPS